MSFTTDKQTLDDLGLPGKFKPNSIYSLFNKVKTAGGERLFNEMFHLPLHDADAINARSATFRYFQEHSFQFPFNREDFLPVENYLSNGSSASFIASASVLAKKKLMHSFLRDEQYTALQTGLRATINALVALKELLQELKIGFVTPARNICFNQKLHWLSEAYHSKEIPLLKAARYDLLLRHTLRKEMEQVLETVYQLDVYMAVSAVARERGFSYAKALPASMNVLEAEALWHPGLRKAVPNPIALNSAHNLFFLTGANMAGKSTLMKSIGIATYLAHAGFPVAAKGMRFSVCDGMYTSINVPDNLDMGYSHFYAEVLRVKKVAEQVSSGKKLLVVFDELFKGTNVKDAYDATLAVTTAFSKYRNCFFIISTHIIEVGDALKKEFDSIRFSYLPTVMNGNTPAYPYTVKEGITSDRQGMTIIENEKILELLEA